MASRRRKRKRSKNKWSPPSDYRILLWTMFGINFLFGLFLSPITSLSVLRASGVPGYDKARIEKLAQSLKDSPRFFANTNQLKSSVLEESSVETVEYRANIFGRGVLSIHYKRAVANISDNRGLVLSTKGSVFRSPQRDDSLPVIVPPHEIGERNLSIVGSWRSRDAAFLCENITNELPKLNWRVVASKSGFVSLTPQEGGIVELGSLSEPEAKIKSLRKILSDDPGLLQKISKLRLYSPQKPVYEP